MDVRITEYTDPGCPFAYSAETSRRRLDWLYGDQLEWRVRMVGLSESPADYEARGFTTEGFSASLREIARDHGMPIDTRERPRMHATLPACRAVVAARGNDPARCRQFLRCLRVETFAGNLLDEPATIRGAAVTAGIDPDALDAWCAEEETERELRADMAAAREPMAAARALDHKLARWSGGQRYTCPSYEITRLADGVTISVPGFQPFAAYDVVLANLVPGTDRRSPAETVEEVLRWTGTPLASEEVAAVCDIDRVEARERLSRVAEERHVGADGFWSLDSSE